MKEMFLINGNNPIINLSKVYTISKENPRTSKDTEIIFAIGEAQVWVFWNFETIQERDQAFEKLSETLQQLINI